jgi:hypothetical protein
MGTFSSSLAARWDHWTAGAVIDYSIFGDDVTHALFRTTIVRHSSRADLQGWHAAGPFLPTVD